MLARDIMKRDVISVPAGTSLADATRLLVAHQINAMPVMKEDGGVAGMIGIRDVIRVPIPSHNQLPILKWDSLEEKVQHFGQMTVDQLMTRQRIVSVSEDASIMDIAGIMANRGVHPVLVLQNGKLVGVVGRADVARALLELSDSTPASLDEPIIERE